MAVYSLAIVSDCGVERQVGTQMSKKKLIRKTSKKRRRSSATEISQGLVKKPKQMLSFFM